MADAPHGLMIYGPQLARTGVAASVTRGDGGRASAASASSSSPASIGPAASVWSSAAADRHGREKDTWPQHPHDPSYVHGRLGSASLLASNSNSVRLQHADVGRSFQHADAGRSLPNPDDYYTTHCKMPSAHVALRGAGPCKDDALNPSNSGLAATQRIDALYSVGAYSGANGGVGESQFSVKDHVGNNSAVERGYLDGREPQYGPGESQNGEREPQFGVRYGGRDSAGSNASMRPHHEVAPILGNRESMITTSDAGRSHVRSHQASSSGESYGSGRADSVVHPDSGSLYKRSNERPSGGERTLVHEVSETSGGATGSSNYGWTEPNATFSSASPFASRYNSSAVAAPPYSATHLDLSAHECVASSQPLYISSDKDSFVVVGRSAAQPSSAPKSNTPLRLLFDDENRKGAMASTAQNKRHNCICIRLALTVAACRCRTRERRGREHLLHQCHHSGPVASRTVPVIVAHRAVAFWCNQGCPSG